MDRKEYMKEYLHNYHQINKIKLNEINKQWIINHPIKFKRIQKKYRLENRKKLSEKGVNYNQLHKKEHNDCQYRWVEKHPIKFKKTIKKYHKTEKFKALSRKNKAKRRLLGYNKKYDNIIIGKKEWHHMNNKDVVAIPKDLHKLYNGKAREEHRFMVNQIVQQIYGGD